MQSRGIPPYIMNQKVSSGQSLAYLTKVKKDMSSKSNTKHVTSDNILETRHEKINFKQYLRDIKEEQSSVSDEFADIELLKLAHASIFSSLAESATSAAELLYVINFGGAFETRLAISETDWEDITDLELDQSTTVRNSSDELWYVTRSVANHLVFESADSEYSGKFNFDEVVKQLVQY